jgi:hypothetical protein
MGGHLRASYLIMGCSFPCHPPSHPIHASGASYMPIIVRMGCVCPFWKPPYSVVISMCNALLQYLRPFCLESAHTFQVSICMYIRRWRASIPLPRPCSGCVLPLERPPPSPPPHPHPRAAPCHHITHNCLFNAHTRTLYTKLVHTHCAHAQTHLCLLMKARK